MTPEQFTYWLQGYSEIAASQPSPEQWKIIQDHLQLVFKKETPIYTPTTPTFPGGTGIPAPWNDQRTVIC
jgi:hypothetical protein